MNISIILKDAKTLIEQNGWGQNYLVNSEGAYCLSGAIQYAFGKYNPNINLIWDSIVDYLGKPLPRWNDEKNRTVDDVYKLLDDMIEYWEAKENEEGN